MTARPDRFGFGGTVPATTARTIAAAEEIMGGDADDIAFIHALLAQTGMPYREPQGREYIRTNGRASMVLQAGYLLDPESRQPVPQGLPYGAKPRLLMVHLCTEAVRRQSPTVPIGDNMSAYMRELGLAVTGGKKGTVGQFKRQLNRLAASRMQLFFDQGDMARTVNPAPVIAQHDVWFPADARQRVLWPSEIVLSAPFYDSLLERALPLDPRAVRGLQHSARALDLYFWLVHRLPRVRQAGGAKVSWAALHNQFGPDVTDNKTFRRAFKAALRQALAVYPHARVESEDGGLRLYSSPTAVRTIEA